MDNLEERLRSISLLRKRQEGRGNSRSRGHHHDPTAVGRNTLLSSAAKSLPPEEAQQESRQERLKEFGRSHCSGDDGMADDVPEDARQELRASSSHPLARDNPSIERGEETKDHHLGSSLAAMKLHLSKGSGDQTDTLDRRDAVVVASPYTQRSQPRISAHSRVERMTRQQLIAKVLALEAQNADMASTIASLHRQHSSQAEELQRVLASSLQRHTSVVSNVTRVTHHTAALTKHFTQLHEEAVALTRHALHAKGSLEALRMHNLECVEAEAGLHDAARLHAEYMQMLDDTLPEGIDGASLAEKSHLQQLQQRLEDAAAAKTSTMDAQEGTFDDLHAHTCKTLEIGLDIETRILGLLGITQTSSAREHQDASDDDNNNNGDDGDDGSDGENSANKRASSDHGGADGVDGGDNQHRDGEDGELGVG